jgi:hypothetical protein
MKTYIITDDKDEALAYLWAASPVWFLGIGLIGSVCIASLRGFLY